MITISLCILLTTSYCVYRQDHYMVVRCEQKGIGNISEIIYK